MVDPMLCARSTTGPENTPMLFEESQLSQGSEHPHTWKPLSLKRASLVCTLTGAVLLLGVTGFLHYEDYQNGAVLIASEGEEFSVTQVFLSRYLPTILVVLYGILISIIDLDIKRLEPWYTLSASNASSGTSPLLCRYDTDFVLIAIAKAFCRR